VCEKNSNGMLVVFFCLAIWVNCVTCNYLVINNYASADTNCASSPVFTQYILAGACVSISTGLYTAISNSISSSIYYGEFNTSKACNDFLASPSNGGKNLGSTSCKSTTYPNTSVAVVRKLSFSSSPPSISVTSTAGFIV